MCQKIWETEWSGFLFFTLEGDLFTHPEQVRITAHDIFLQDIGSVTHTQFNNDGEALIEMYDKHPDWMKCRMGLIHSHNNMPTFFSGEDVSELQDNCPGTDFYFSLICNNKGSYTARAAYMQEIEIETKSIVKFLNSTRQTVIKDHESSKTMKQHMIQIEFEVEVEEEPLEDWFEARIEEIKATAVRDGRKSSTKKNSQRENEWDTDYRSQITFNQSLRDQIDEFDPDQIEIFTQTSAKEKTLTIDQLVAKVIASDDKFTGTIKDAIGFVKDNYNSDDEYTASEIFDGLETVVVRATKKPLNGELERKIIDRIESLNNSEQFIQLLQKFCRQYFLSL